MVQTNRTTTEEAHGDAPRSGLPHVGRGSLGAAGLAGLAYVLSGSVTPPDGPPVATATAAQFRDYVTSSGTAIQAAAIAGMLGVAAALVFFAGLTRQVRNRLPGSPLADLLLASALLVVVYQWLATTAEAMTTLLPNLVESDLGNVDDATLRGWYGLTGLTHFMGDLAVVPMAVVLASFSIAGLRAGLLPTWLSLTGLGFSGAGVLGSVGILAAVDMLYTFWFVALFGYWLWILAVAITFLIRLRRSHSPSLPAN